MMRLLHDVPPGGGFSSRPVTKHRAAQVLRSRRAAPRPEQTLSGGPFRPISFLELRACGPP